MAKAPLLLVLLLLVPMASAQILLDPNGSAESVIGGNLMFAPGNTFSQGTSITLTGPAGQTATVVRTGDSTIPEEENDAVGFSLDGTQFTGSAQWTWVGNLNGVPADGTWKIQVESPGYTSSNAAAPPFQPSIRLYINDRGITFAVNTNIPTTTVQQWNRHFTASTLIWIEPSTANGIQATTIDPPNEAVDEDPINSKFFPPASPSRPQAATGGSTLTCPATLSVEGAWVRGATQTANTFVRFVHVSGFDPSDADLRDNVGASSTNLVNDGSAGSGTHAESIVYNNAAGTSYQFVARSGASGPESLGNVIALPANLCTISNPTIALAEIHDESAFDLTASQAQCSGDPVAFSIDIQIGSALVAMADLDVYIQNAATGATVLQVDDGDMRFIGNRVVYFAREVQAGAYTAIAKLDLAGPGALDFYDSAAFTVPFHDCGPTDLAALLAGLARHDVNQAAFWANGTADHAHLNAHAHDLDAKVAAGFANLTAYIDHVAARLRLLDGSVNATRGELLDALDALELTVVGGNFTGNFTMDNATLKAIWDTVQEHRALSPEYTAQEAAEANLHFTAALWWLVWIVYVILTRFLRERWFGLGAKWLRIAASLAGFGLLALPIPEDQRVVLAACQFIVLVVDIYLLINDR